MAHKVLSDNFVTAGVLLITKLIYTSMYTSTFVEIYRALNCTHGNNFRTQKIFFFLKGKKKKKELPFTIIPALLPAYHAFLFEINQLN